MTRKELNRAIKAVNNVICSLPNYHNEIPLGTLFSELEANGLVALQEDDTKWDGFICGAEGNTTFNLGDLSKPTRNDWGYTYKPNEHVLVMSWYKMPSGRYEIVSFVS